MIETVMLYVALAVTEPSGNTIDEEFRVMSRHFDTEQECEEEIYGCYHNSACNFNPYATSYATEYIGEHNYSDSIF